MQVHDSNVVIVNVSKYDAAKCMRCWHRDISVGQDAEHLTICSRCISNLDGGEVRQYA